MFNSGSSLAKPIIQPSNWLLGMWISGPQSFNKTVKTKQFSLSPISRMTINSPQPPRNPNSTPPMRSCRCRPPPMAKTRSADPRLRLCALLRSISTTPEERLRGGWGGSERLRATELAACREGSCTAREYRFVSFSLGYHDASFWTCSCNPFCCQIFFYSESLYYAIKMSIHVSTGFLPDVLYYNRRYMEIRCPKTGEMQAPTATACLLQALALSMTLISETSDFAVPSAVTSLSAVPRRRTPSVAASPVPSVRHSQPQVEVRVHF